jgi:hypothetical protein
MVAGVTGTGASANDDLGFQEEMKRYWTSILGEPFLDRPRSSETLQSDRSLLKCRMEAVLGSSPAASSMALSSSGAATTAKGTDYLATVIGNNVCYQPTSLKDHETCKECKVARNYCAAVWGINYRRRLFRTKLGYFGLGSSNVVPGDQVVVLFGGRVPFVLRKKSKHYRLISDCYVRGIMNGELINAWKQGLIESEDVQIL